MELAAILIAIIALLLVLSSHKAPSKPAGQKRTRKKKYKKNYRQGIFIPQFPDKYRGDASNIIYRSGWELTAFEWCDLNPHVIAWASEEKAIPYYMKGSRYPKKYFPDLLIYFRRDGTVMVEIKPKEEKLKPSYQNTCKWAAARAHCEEKGWKFIIWDETVIDKFHPKINHWRRGQR